MEKGNQFVVPLGLQVQPEWATPQAHDSTPGNPERVGRFGTAAGGRNLNDEAAKIERAPIRGVLNSRWVSQLLGYPASWLAMPTKKLIRLYSERLSGGRTGKA